MTHTALAELLARDLSSLDLVCLMIDGVGFGEHTCVVALGISIDGTKHPLALVEGATENATLARDLLVGLRECSLDVTRPILVVIDGAKALRRAVSDVFNHPVIARCQQHKIRINRPWRVGQARTPGSAACWSGRTWLSMLVMTRAWRATSECQPRASASSRSARTSASCAWRAGRNSVVVTKLSHCSQMFTNGTQTVIA